MLLKLAPVALFTKYRLTTSSGQQLEGISHAHFVSLMYKLALDKLVICLLVFTETVEGGNKELTNNKDIKGKRHGEI